MNFHILPQELTSFLRVINDDGGEITDEKLLQLEKLADGTQDALRILALLVEDNEEMEKIHRDRAASSLKAARRRERNATRARERLFAIMTAAGLGRAQVGGTVLSVRTGPEKVVVDESTVDVLKLDERWVRVTREVDKQALMDAKRQKDREDMGMVVNGQGVGTFTILPDGVTFVREKYLHIGLK